MARPKISSSPPTTVGVLSSGQEVEYPTPSAVARHPGGGVSRSTVRGMIRRMIGGIGAPARAILPVFDVDTDADGPGLAYKVRRNNDTDQIIIRGEGLIGITVVDLSTDVQVGGNVGGAPVVDGALVVTDTSITVPIDASGTSDNDMWGVILRDADGNVYGAPSAIKIFDVA